MLAAGMVLVAMLPVAVSAAEVRAGEQAAIAQGETIPHNAYLAGGSLVSSGTIGGDLIAAGGSLVVNGPVGADLLATGGNLSILGNVAGDLRAAGGTIAITGSVAGDLIAAGGNITAAGSKIGGDALLAGGAIRLTTPVAGSVRIRGGQVVIDAPVAGDLDVHAQSLTFGSHAVVTGNLTYEAPKAATMQEGASVKGKTTFTPVVNVSEGPAAALALFSVWILASLAALMLTALLFRALFRRYVVEAENAVVTRPWHKLGMGFIAFAVTPPAIFVLCLTVVGIPLGVVAGLGYAALLVVSWMFAPIVIGAFIEQWWHARAPQGNWQFIVYGAIAYVVVGLIPVVGGIFKFVAILMALGTIVEKKWEIASEWV